MINKRLAKLLIEEALKTGGDFAELYIEEATGHTIIFDNNIVESIGNNSILGVGIRILKKNQSVYGFTNEIKEKALLELVYKLRSAFNESQSTHALDFIDYKVKSINENNETYFKTPIKERIEILKHTSLAMKSYSSLISRTIMVFAGDKKQIEIYNSEGLHVKDKQEHTRLIFKAEASKDDKHEIAYKAMGTTGTMDYFKKFNLDEIAKRVAFEATEALDAKECPSGKMDVIIGNGGGGVLFHEACGHSLEASAVSRNLSVFTNRIGEQIASTIINAYDDGTIKGRWGSITIDDEGHKSERTCLIKNGILNEYMIDRFNGRRMNKEANGSCRRQNYKYEPTSRMSNTYIDNGTSTVEEIIKSTKLGLYAKGLAGGSVDPSTGQFEFGCSLAYIVRDGKICERVKGATLIGTGEEVLKNIDMIANDLDLDTGYCGAASGMVPVSTGQPTLRVKNLLVGGNGGVLK